jgi:hypothetical protein
MSLEECSTASPSGPKEAADAARNAVRLNPNYAAAYAQLAQDQAAPAEYPRTEAYLAVSDEV